MHTSPASQTTTRIRRTLSIAAAASLVAVPLLTSPASAATTTVKTIKVGAKQCPTALDRPGTTADLLRLTNIAGVTWKIDGTAQEMGTAKTTDVAGVNGATVTAEVTDSSKYALAGPTSWTMAFSSDKLDVADPTGEVVWIDAPGDKDSVILPKKEGIAWTVGTVTYTPESFGKKTSLTLKATTATTVSAAVLGESSGTWTGSDAVSTLTSVTPVVIADATVTGALAVGDNPLDSTKGYGKGASYETVKVTGVAGAKWKVGTSAKAKAYAVKPGVVAYLRVDPDDIDDVTNKVTVTPVPDKGYSLATTGFTTQLDFTDGSSAPSIAVANAVLKGDRGGLGSDTLVMAAPRNMTWWFGQKDAKTGLIVYKAQKAGKDGNATYKVKHVKGATDTDVWVKPVADRGYTIDAAGLSTKQYNFTTADISIGSTAAVGTNQVTLTEKLGVDSWAIEDTVSGKTVKTTIKRADLVNAGVGQVVVPTTVATAKVTVKYLKGYAE